MAGDRFSEIEVNLVQGVSLREATGEIGYLRPIATIGLGVDDPISA
jgi:hypothetical protein